MNRILRLLLIPLTLTLTISLGLSFFQAFQAPTAEPEAPSVEPESPSLSPEDLAAKAQAERDALEAQRKAERKEFYVPLLPLDSTKEKIPVVAKALYLTANIAGMAFNEEDVQTYADYILAKHQNQSFDEARLSTVNRLEEVLGMVMATEINALVIDIKDDRGLVAYRSDIEFVNSHGSNWNTPLKEFDRLMAYLKANEVYTIARIVAFKDPYTAEERPDHAIQLAAGGVYRDKAGFAWVNPFDPFIWDYLVAVSQEAALRGFDEIQYDYVRFPDNAKSYNPITFFPFREERNKDEAIRDFLAYAKHHLEPYSVFISADVFGVITYSWDDQPEDIGQTWRHIGAHVDVISPMIYPSHYGSGFYGFSVPDQHPYAVIRQATQEALERNAAMRNPPVLRSWFQAFSAPWVKGSIKYDAQTIAEQMIANHELGLDEYILWNSQNIYDPMTFFYQDRLKTRLVVGDIDILERSPEATLERYLKADRSAFYRNLYLLTPIDLRADEYDDFEVNFKAKERQLIRYTLGSVTKVAEGHFTIEVNARYETPTQVAENEAFLFKVHLENRVFKVTEPDLVWVNK